MEDCENEVRMEVPVDDVMDRLPEKLFDLDAVKDCVLFDIDRNQVTFGSLLDGKSTIMFVFIRHFLDYVTREYVEDFSKIFPHSLEKDHVKIIFIGCAPAKFIRQFKEATSCPHDIYCDSKRIIYSLMGFHTVPTTTPVANSPHIKTNSFIGFWQTVWRTVVTHGEQGDAFQMGGQLIIDQDEKVSYFYRDRHTMDHTPINDLLAVVGLPRIDFCTKFRIQHV